MAKVATSTSSLYLEIYTGAGAPERLAAALAVAHAEAVLIRPLAGREPSQADLRNLVAIAQSNGAAALVCGSPELATAANADGIHLPWSVDVEGAYREARRTLGAGKIIGAEAGITRHDAMVLAESGADYVAFALAHSPADANAFTSASLLDTMAWWSEIFEVPGVAVGVVEIADAIALAGVRTDFIGFQVPPGETAATAGERVAALVAALGSASQTARRPEARPPS